MDILSSSTNVAFSKVYDHTKEHLNMRIPEEKLTKEMTQNRSSVQESYYDDTQRVSKLNKKQTIVHIIDQKKNYEVTISRIINKYKNIPGHFIDTPHSISQREANAKPKCSTWNT